MKRLALAKLALVAVTVCAPALDIDQGRLRLRLHEGIGRFSLYYLPDRPGASYVPLLLDSDPRTTVLTIAEGNRAHRMGESSAFTEKLEKGSDALGFVWTSKTLEVVQRFSFLASSGSVLADGLRIDITVRNLADSPLTVGLRYLFDTELGEPSGTHFWTPSMERIDREYTLVPRETESFWVSAPAKGSEGLQVMVAGSGITRPARAVFANWKRLNEAPWAYETSSARNFNELPYSINDSAVCHYYDPRELAPGESFTVTLAMGLYAPGGFAAGSAARSTQVTEIVEKAASAAAADPLLALKADLETLDRLIAEIDRQLDSGEVRESDLPLIEKLLADLQAKYR